MYWKEASINKEKDQFEAENLFACLGSFSKYKWQNKALLFALINVRGVFTDEKIN
ncbi:hypothetical protein CHCC20335_2606 [Bacillus paralicheniformis]|nr:hypothetical protein CHCC20335_2606 [Bacillus paralicheniformis]